MARHVIIFAIAFAAAAIMAIGIRAALYRPGEVVAAPPGGAAAATAPVSTATTTAAPTDAATVNTICPICSMAVRASLGSEEWQGKRVGFGCGACPALFRADPGRYGPAALANRVAER